MKSRLWVGMIVVAVLAFVGPSANSAAPDPDRDAIDVAICLDTSGSMQALIDATRIALWEIVNDLSQAEPTPRLRVALLTYGNRAGGQQGWARVEADLTSDLDLVSERLFEIGSDKGGVEYVGRVLKLAVGELDWTESDRALKLIFVAGNEPADQDPEVSFRDMSDDARREGIFVHAIYCGTEKHADAESWKEMAGIAQGRFATIDPRAAKAVAQTPFDAELANLSGKINETYIPLGEEGQDRLDKLAKRDENTRETSPAAAASRAEAKTSQIYSSGWELVDAVATGQVVLDEMEEEALPEVLKKMSPVDREVYIEEMAAQRAEIRKQILELSESRRQYVAKQIAEKGIDTSLVLDQALRRSIREEADAMGLEFSKP